MSCTYSNGVCFIRVFNNQLCNCTKYIHCRVLSMEEKLKDNCTSYESKLLVEEKRHRDAVVCNALEHEKGVLP